MQKGLQPLRKTRVDLQITFHFQRNLILSESLKLSCWHQRQLGGEWGWNRHSYLTVDWQITPVSPIGLSRSYHWSLLWFTEKRGDESLSWMRREWWYTNKLLLQTVPTRWLRVFPAGSISMYAVGDWGECQQNHTLAWNRCSRVAVQDTTEPGAKLKLSKATLTLQLQRISSEQLTTMSIVLHAMSMLDWTILQPTQLKHREYLKLVLNLRTSHWIPVFRAFDWSREKASALSELCKNHFKGAICDIQLQEKQLLQRTELAASW